AGELGEERQRLAVDRLVDLAAVRVLHDRHAAALEVEELVARALEDRQRQTSGTSVEVRHSHLVRSLSAAVCSFKRPRMKILYGVVGEGMGHAMRSRVILAHLVAQGHEVEIMASGRAVDFLAKHFAGVNRIHGLHMIYEENRVRRGKTLWSNVLSGAVAL